MCRCQCAAGSPAWTCEWPYTLPESAPQAPMTPSAMRSVPPRTSPLRSTMTGRDHPSRMRTAAPAPSRRAWPTAKRTAIPRARARGDGASGVGATDKAAMPIRWSAPRPCRNPSVSAESRSTPEFYVLTRTPREWDGEHRDGHRSDQRRSPRDAGTMVPTSHGRGGAAGGEHGGAAAQVTGMKGSPLVLHHWKEALFTMAGLAERFGEHIEIVKT